MNKEFVINWGSGQATYRPFSDARFYTQDIHNGFSLTALQAILRIELDKLLTTPLDDRFQELDVDEAIEQGYSPADSNIAVLGNGKVLIQF